MNNTILINGADFSSAKIGELNIQKLTIVADSTEGAIDLSSGSFVPVSGDPSSGWNPDQEYLHSTEITFPEGAKYLFGKLNFVTSNTRLNTYLSTPGQTVFYSNVGIWFWYDSNAGTWTKIDGLNNTLYTKPQIIGYKKNIYSSNNYACVLVDGGIYGTRIPDSRNITKIRVNWLKRNAPSAPELGLDLPELYAGF